MLGSVLVDLGLAAEVVAVDFSAITGYRAFSLSRSLPGPIYRVRAEWTWIFSVIVIGVTGIFFTADLEIGGSFISQFLTGVNFYLTLFALVVLFAWVSSTIGVAFEQDFFPEMPCTGVPSYPLLAGRYHGCASFFLRGGTEGLCHRLCRVLDLRLPAL